GVTPLGERLGDNLLGTGLTVLLAQQGASGNVTGSGPRDPALREAMRAEGWQPNAVKVGDRYYSYVNWGPLGTFLGAIGAYGDAVRYAQPGEDSTAALGRAATAMGSLLVDQTALYGLGSLYDALRNPSEDFGQMAQALASSFVPLGGALATTAQVSDPYQRQTEGVGDYLASRIPGARQALPVARDVYGSPVPNPFG